MIPGSHDDILEDTSGRILNVLSLFSGIAGLDLGFDITGAGKPVMFVEFDPFCRKVLESYWPDVPTHDDVTTFDAKTAERLPKIDVVCGGFPCQDLSTAGKRAGMDGARSGLWGEMARIIGLVRPEWVLIENVRGLLSGKGRSGIDEDDGDTSDPEERTVDGGHGGDGDRTVSSGAFGDVLGSLADLGYDVRWDLLRASDVGAPHRRERVFIVGRLALADGRERARRTVSSRANSDPGASGDALADTGRLVVRVGSRGESEESGHDHGCGETVEDAPDRTGVDVRGGRHDTGIPGDGRTRDAGTSSRSMADPDGGDGRALVEGTDPDRGTPVGRSGEELADTPVRGRLTGGTEQSPVARGQAPRFVDDAGGSMADPAGVDASRSVDDGTGGERPETPIADESRTLADDPPELRGVPWPPGPDDRDGWEDYLTRWGADLAPALPVGRDGGMRLNPSFVEALMGFPVGWTDIRGAGRNKRLKALGNAVVPQCAARVVEKWILPYICPD